MVREVDEAVANSTYTQGRVSCIADTFVQAESSVLRTNFCAEKPAHRQSAKRYAQFYDKITAKINNQINIKKNKHGQFILHSTRTTLWSTSM
jgi:hypothetical protein